MEYYLLLQLIGIFISIDIFNIFGTYTKSYFYLLLNNRGKIIYVILFPIGTVGYFLSNLSVYIFRRLFTIL